MPEISKTHLGGTMRLGSRPTIFQVEDCMTRRLYGGGTQVDERHRHRYEVNPDLIINAAAYTAVDRAEIEPEIAYAINSKAPLIFAEVLLKTGGKLIQLSTDFVFDGKSETPYKPNEKVNPFIIASKYKFTQCFTIGIIDSLKFLISSSNIESKILLI